MVKRYTECMSRYEEGQPDMRVDPTGEYVRHIDYAALAERCERLEGALRVLADYPLEDFMQEGRPDDRELFGANDWHLRVGDVKRARSLLSGSSGGKE